MISLRQATTVGDSETLWKIIKHSSVWDSVTLDELPDRNSVPPPPTPLWLMVELDGETVGFWAFTYRFPGCWEAHTALLPIARSKDRNASGESFQVMLKWVRENSSIVRLVGEIPSCNETAIRYTLRNGMAEYGRNPECWMKNGKLWDTVLVGMKIER
jgi:RimJ/RimL family protein N-acetyltransferase